MYEMSSCIKMRYSKFLTGLIEKFKSNVTTLLKPGSFTLVF